MHDMIHQKEAPSDFLVLVQIISYSFQKIKIVTFPVVRRITAFLEKENDWVVTIEAGPQFQFFKPITNHLHQHKFVVLINRDIHLVDSLFIEESIPSTIADVFTIRSCNLIV